MDTRAQMQAIVDRLTGAPSKVLPPPSALDQPWRTIYARVTSAADRTEAELLIWNATKGLADRERRRRWLRDLVALLPAGGRFSPPPSLHEMSATMPDVEWLWPSWIPRGMVTLFGAAPGAGKSLVALDLARRIIHGEPFPDGAPVPCPGSNVLIVDAEGAPHLLNQRATAWDIDRRRLFLMLAAGPGGLIDLDNPKERLRLINMCKPIRPPLIIIDSLAAATARGETSLQGARNTLGFLSALARKAGLALLVIHHLRKGTGYSPRVTAGDLRGSTHLSAAARSVLALSWVGASVPAPFTPPADPAAPSAPPSRPQTPFDDPRRLEVIKTNLCRHPPPLGLTFEGHDLPVPTLRYTELIEPPPQPTQTELCADWLYQFLAGAGEPVKPADAIRAAAEAGFPQRTLYRARQALSGWVVDLGSSRYDPNKRWILAGSPPPSDPGTPNGPATPAQL